MHSDGADADKLLIAGSGLAVGYGATSHSDSLPGAVARAMSDLTARGTDVDVIADAGLTAARAATEFPAERMWRFDELVLTLGVPEALALVPVREWRRRLTATLDAVRAAATPGARIALVAIGPVLASPGFEGREADAVRAHAAELDAASEALLEGRDNERFVRLYAATTDYRALAEELVDAVLDDVYAAREETQGVARGPAGVDPTERDRRRQEALEALGILDTPPEDRFDRIVSMAQKLYGTDGAAFTIIDNDRVWHKSRIRVPESVPRGQSFCDATIRGRGAHIIHDVAHSDELPDDMTTADELGIAFYAGFPVEAPNGEPIGALCVFDERPRAHGDVDEALLRQLALLIQAELRVEALGRR